MPQLKKAGLLLWPFVVLLSLILALFLFPGASAEGEETSDLPSAEEPAAENNEADSSVVPTVYGTQVDTGLISVYGLPDSLRQGDMSFRVYAYPVVLASYDTQGRFVRYQALYDDIDLESCQKTTVTYRHFLSTDLVASGSGNLSAAIFSWMADYNGNHPSSPVTIRDLSFSYTYQFSDAQVNSLSEQILGDAASIYTYQSADPYGSALQAMTGDSGKQYYELSPVTEDGETYYTYVSDGMVSGVASGAYLIVMERDDTVLSNTALVATWYPYAEHFTGPSDLLTFDCSIVAGLPQDGSVRISMDTPTLDVQISAPTADDLESNLSAYQNKAYGCSYSIGCTVCYDIEIGNILNLEGPHAVFSLTDTLPDSLTLVGSTFASEDTDLHDGIQVTVPDGDSGSILLTENQDYTVSIEPGPDSASPMAGATLQIDFLVHEPTGSGSYIASSCPYDSQDGSAFSCNGYHLNDYQGTGLTVSVSAFLNERAAVNGKSNDNCVTLLYAQDGSQEENIQTVQAAAHVYTFDLDGASTGYDENGGFSCDTRRLITVSGTGEYEGAISQNLVLSTALEGAGFVLYQTEDDNWAREDAVRYATWENGMFRGWSEEQEDACQILSNAEGQLLCSGLAAGSYYITQTAAPYGYSKSSTVYRMDLSTSLDETGTLLSWMITVTTLDSNGVDIGSSTSRYRVLPDTEVDISDAQEQTSNPDAEFLTSYYNIQSGGVLLRDQNIFTQQSDGSYLARYTSGNISHTLTATKNVTSDGTVLWTVTHASSSGNTTEYLTLSPVEQQSTRFLVQTVSSSGKTETTIDNDPSNGLRDTPFSHWVFTGAWCIVVVGAVALYVLHQYRKKQDPSRPDGSGQTTS